MLGLKPTMGILGRKHTTAFIMTPDMNCYPVIIAKPERGYFFARIDNEVYCFLTNSRSIYNVKLRNSLYYPRMVIYMLNDAHPINFDDVAKMRIFMDLNPGTKITPEIASIMLSQEGLSTYDSIKVPGTGTVVAEPGEKGGRFSLKKKPKDAEALEYGPDEIAQTDEEKAEFEALPDFAKTYVSSRKRIDMTLDKLKMRINAGDRSECQVIDLEQYFEKNAAPGDMMAYATQIIAEYGSKWIIVPPVKFTDMFSSRMTDMTGVLGIADRLVSKGMREFDRIANPAKSAKNYWFLIAMVGGLGAVMAGVLAWLFLGSGGGVDVNSAEFWQNLQQSGAQPPDLSGGNDIGSAIQQSVDQLTSEGSVIGSLIEGGAPGGQSITEQPEISVGGG